MRRLVMVVLLLFTVVVAANYQKAVYVNADQTLAVDKQAELTILHVWAEKADAASFRIGQSYQLAGKDISFSGHLFSITYAISRPDDIKLSLYLAPDQTFTIQQQQVFSILPQHM
jgi:hypothetical protein